MSLLYLYAPEIPLSDNFCVLSILDEEISSANTVVVRADEKLSLSTLHEQSLLKRLLSDTDTMTLQVGLQCRPRLGIVTPDGVRKEKLQNQPVGTARRQRLDVTLYCAKEWHGVLLSNRYSTTAAFVGFQPVSTAAVCCGGGVGRTIGLWKRGGKNGISRPSCPPVQTPHLTPPNR